MPKHLLNYSLVRRQSSQSQIRTGSNVTPESFWHANSAKRKRRHLRIPSLLMLHAVRRLMTDLKRVDPSNGTSAG
jgi:hypothetical protein